jgi:hypothetical protein
LVSWPRNSSQWTTYLGRFDTESLRNNLARLAVEVCDWLTPAVDLSLLRYQPTLVGQAVRLEPLGPEHFDGLRPLFVGDAPGPLAMALAEQVKLGLVVAKQRPDRADWAIVTIPDGRVVGEVVLFELDADHDSMSSGSPLAGPDRFDLGYGSEATRLVRDFALRCPRTASAHPGGVREQPRARGASTPGRASSWKGVRREVQRVPDGVWDTLDMGMLASDPRP